MGNRFGYIGNEVQNIAENMEAIKAFNIQERNIYIEHDLINRTKFNEMLQLVLQGDTVIVSTIKDISYNLKGFISLLERIESTDLILTSVKEDLCLDKNTAKVLIEIFNTYEDCTVAGNKVKRKGNYKGRTKIHPDQKLFETVYKLWRLSGDNNISTKAAQQMLQLKPNSFYRRVKEFEDAQIIDF